MALYLLSLLSFPSGILWIFWAGAIFRKQPGFQRMLQAGSALALLLAGAYLGWLMAQDQGYGILGKTLQLSYVLAGMGRGLWTIFFPFWLAPYYSPESPFSLAGLALGALLAFAAWKYRHALAPVAHLLALAAAFALPPFFLVLTYPEFVWADRYLFLISSSRWEWWRHGREECPQKRPLSESASCSKALPSPPMPMRPTGWRITRS